MFDVCNRSFNLMWVQRRIAINYQPDFMRAVAMKVGLARVAKSPALGKLVLGGMTRMIPGYLLLRNMDRYSRYIDI
jgi:hypothetical protein